MQGLFTIPQSFHKQLSIYVFISCMDIRIAWIQSEKEINKQWKYYGLNLISFHAHASMHHQIATKVQSK